VRSWTPTCPLSPFLYPILDVALLGGRSIPETVGALAGAGVGMMQLRAKPLRDRDLLEAARVALEAARSVGCRLIVNDRPDVARLVGADGVHVGQNDLAPADARRLLPQEAIVGMSTHSLEQLKAATREAVDYIAVGPIFPTRTKADPDPVVGLQFIRAARRHTSLPVVAIGGITRQTARAVIDAGASGVAMASGLLSGTDVTIATRDVLAAMEDDR
jgi:thiamine-phosphate pyrophosphorylase